MTPLGTEFPDHFDVCIVCGQYGAADFVLNVMLFVPLGFGLRLAGVRRRWAWLAGALLTITIETLQYYVVPGRDSGLNDLISNSTGAALGIALADSRHLLLIPSEQRARRLVGVWILFCCAGAASLQWAVTPDLPRSIYYEQVVPELGHFGVFDGTVYHATFNDARFRIGRLSPDSSAAMRAALLAGSAVIATTISPGSVPTHLAPIVSVFDRQRREIFILGRRRDDLAFRFRRRTEKIALHTPIALLPHAMPRGHDDDTLSVTAIVERGATVLSVAGSGRQLRRRVGFGIEDAWRLFLPDDGYFGVHDTLWMVVSMIALWLPLGYWAARAVSHRTAPVIAGVVVALIGTLAIIPWTAAAPVALPPVWAVSIAAIAIGWLASRWTGGYRDRSAIQTTAAEGKHPQVEQRS